MVDREPEPRNPLGPFYPSEVAAVPGNARTWFAVLFALLLLVLMSIRLLTPLSV